MENIIFAVVLLAVIGVIAGFGLALAAKIFAVPVDEKAEAIEEILPGANCGACGFSGCSGYAAALSQGKTTDTARCAPGGNDVAKQIAAYLGVEAGSVVPSAAVVLCNGISSNAKTKMNYVGVDSCRMANQLFGGPKECIYGCIGLGDCAKACPYGAIKICDGVARIDPLSCRACKLCVRTCPKNLIELKPIPYASAAVLCKNKDKGVMTMKECSVGCIGCMKCTKVCEVGAVTVSNNVAHVDTEKCTGCGKCTEACPKKCINLIQLNK